MNEEKINLIIETLKDVDKDIIWRFIDLDTEQYEDDRKAVFYILNLIDEYKRLKENEQAYLNTIGKQSKEIEELKAKLILTEHTGKLVRNKRDNNIGVVLREWKTGQIQVMERIYPSVINTHDNWKTLEILEEE